MQAPPHVHWTRGGPVEGEVATGDLERLSVQTRATAADALPLGMGALGTVLVTSGAILATWFRPTGSGVLPVLPGILIFGGLVQLLAAMWAYRRDDLLGATAFGVFGAFFSTAGVMGLMAGSLFRSAQYGPLGVLICCFGLVAAFLAVAGLRVGIVTLGIYAALAVSLFLAGAALIAGLNVALIVASGWAGVASGLLALYLAGAYTINSYYGRNLLPLRGGERRYRIKLVPVTSGGDGQPHATTPPQTT